VSGPTPEETRLAEELVALVDYAGRILFTGPDGRGPHYLWEKSRELARVADRIGAILDDDGVRRGADAPVRTDAVRRAVEAWSQRHPAGRLLFPRRRGGGPRNAGGAP
jgi:hypothetical protein